MISVEQIKQEYPLHWCVWNDNFQDLRQLLNAQNVSVCVIN